MEAMALVSAMREAAGKRMVVRVQAPVKTLA
jgi:hypothetical protein